MDSVLYKKISSFCCNFDNKGESICDLADRFTAKIPGYDETIAAVGDALIVYEITFPTATVTVDMEHSGTVTI